jgi:hypothetical protein
MRRHRSIQSACRIESGGLQPTGSDAWREVFSWGPAGHRSKIWVTDRGIGALFSRCGDEITRDQEKRADWLAVDRSEFRVADLNQPLKLSEKFDLAVCIEVAEHLQRAAAAPLVQTLTSVAPVVLFSAAIPGQGGHGHYNEQPRSFWHALFAQHGSLDHWIVAPEASA